MAISILVALLVAILLISIALLIHGLEGIPIRRTRGVIVEPWVQILLGVVCSASTIRILVLLRRLTGR